ncbi:MAG: TorF family putative porin [Gammaproteobacteria bacterium]|nr:TorF family putative porin [Gammaproteobacteria bacterium]
MKLKTISTLCFAASTMLVASSAMAWESEDGAWSTSANVALSSEYVWRGVGQSASDPAISGGFDVGHSSGLYAGIWGSNVDFDSDASVELDYYAGFSGDFGDSGVSFDIGGLYYDYPSEDELNFFEVYGFVSYSFLSAGVSYSMDLFDTEAEDDLYYQLDASYDVGSISLAAGVGRYDYDASASEDYTNWYIGASTELAGFGLDVTYHDTNLDGSDTDTVVFTISKSM